RLVLEIDGRITAQQIVNTWELDADLVVLSACETGLGRPAGGEGYLGFTQALFAKGARSVVLSLWKVDDRATALLMARFYRNLLGRRPGLSAALPKAEALDEAGRWRRSLSKAEASAEPAAVVHGERGRLARRRGSCAGQAGGPGSPAVRPPEILGRLPPRRRPELRGRSRGISLSSGRAESPTEPAWRHTRRRIGRRRKTLIT